MTDIDKQKAVEDLKIVRTIMETCARRQQDDGIYLIIWGLLIPVATGLNYLIVYLEKWQLFGPLWGGVMLIGCVLSAVTGFRRGSDRSMTHGAKIQAAVWVVSIFSIVLLMVTGFASGDIKRNMIMTVLSLIMANAIFISGMLSGTKMLKFVSGGWWAVGILCAFLPQYTAPAVVGAATFILSFIPGLILDRRYRNERL